MPCRIAIAKCLSGPGFWVDSGPESFTDCGYQVIADASALQVPGHFTAGVTDTAARSYARPPPLVPLVDRLDRFLQRVGELLGGADRREPGGGQVLFERGHARSPFRPSTFRL